MTTGTISVEKDKSMGGCGFSYSSSGSTNNGMARKSRGVKCLGRKNKMSFLLAVCFLTKGVNNVECGTHGLPPEARDVPAAPAVLHQLSEEQLQLWQSIACDAFTRPTSASDRSSGASSLSHTSTHHGAAVAQGIQHDMFPIHVTAGQPLMRAASASAAAAGFEQQASEKQRRLSLTSGAGSDSGAEIHPSRLPDGGIQHELFPQELFRNVGVGNVAAASPTSRPAVDHALVPAELDALTVAFSPEQQRQMITPLLTHTESAKSSLVRVLTSPSSSPQQKRQILGEHLHPAVVHCLLRQGMQPTLAGKITGMVLEMETGEVLNLLQDESELKVTVDKALGMLAAHKEESSAISDSGVASGLPFPPGLTPPPGLAVAPPPLPPGPPPLTPQQLQVPSANGLPKQDLPPSPILPQQKAIPVQLQLEQLLLPTGGCDSTSASSRSSLSISPPKQFSIPNSPPQPPPNHHGGSAPASTQGFPPLPPQAHVLNFEAHLQHYFHQTPAPGTSPPLVSSPAHVNLPGFHNGHSQIFAAAPAATTFPSQGSNGSPPITPALSFSPPPAPASPPVFEEQYSNDFKTKLAACATSPRHQQMMGNVDFLTFSYHSPQVMPDTIIVPFQYLPNAHWYHLFGDVADVLGRGFTHRLPAFSIGSRGIPLGGQMSNSVFSENLLLPDSDLDVTLLLQNSDGSQLAPEEFQGHINKLLDHCFQMSGDFKSHHMKILGELCAQVPKETRFKIGGFGPIWLAWDQEQNRHVSVRGVHDPWDVRAKYLNFILDKTFFGRIRNQSHQSYISS